MTVQPYQAPLPAGYVQQPNGMVVPQSVRTRQGLSVGVHGFQKQGKSSFGDSGPRPTLILDVETAGFWTPSTKIYWDPKRETCPQWPYDPRAQSPDGLWDTCIVIIHNYQELYDLLTFLNLGNHPFNSVSMDSVTEIQQRIMYELTGTKQMEQKHWGALLRNVNALIRGYRDLITHPTRPVWAVTYIMGTHWDNRTSKFRPLVQGASQDYLPYVPDVLGWLEAAPDGSRHMWIGPSQSHETGERIWGRLPYDLQLGYPGIYPGWTMQSMVEQVLSK